MSSLVANLSERLKQLIDTFKSDSTFRKIEHLIVLAVLFGVAKNIKKGVFLKKIVRALTSSKMVQKKLNQILEKESNQIVQNMFKGKPTVQYFEIPQKGIDHQQLIQILKERQKQNLNPSEGKAFAYVYEVNEQHNELVSKAFEMFMHTNILNGDKKCVGNVTSGGSESIFLAMKAYRDHYKHNHPNHEGNVEVILCITAHPAFNKAAKILNIDLVYVDSFQNSFKMRHDQIAGKVTKNTCLIVTSAPMYPQGIVDQIDDVCAIAKKFNLPVHVDSAIGGYVLPYMEKLGEKVPKWDFRNSEVQSINLDVHKYGYAPKGSSVLVFRNSEYRNFYFTTYSQWPGGLYISPTVMGSRNGGSISSAWASLMALGHDGFMEQTKKILEIKKYWISEISKIKGLQILGEPPSSLISFNSNDSSLNIFHVSDAMDELGWNMERQSKPDSLHMSIMPQHYGTRIKFMEDLNKAVQIVRENPKKYAGDSAAMYGMIGSIPDDVIVDDFLVKFLDRIYAWDQN